MTLHIRSYLLVNMAKIFKIMDPLDQQQPSTLAHCEQTDWSKCILCQENTSEVLHCPDESKCNTQGAEKRKKPAEDVDNSQLYSHKLLARVWERKQVL